MLAKKRHEEILAPAETMYKQLLPFAFVLWVAMPTMAQRVGLPARKLTIQPLQWLVREAVVAYEFPVHKRVSFQVGAGYRFRGHTTSTDYRTGTGWLNNYDWYYMFNPYHQAVKVAAGPIFYLNDRRSLYLQSEYFFRHWWLNDTRLVQEAGTDGPPLAFDALRTERINVYGLKVLLGSSQRVARLSEQTNLLWSFFVGAGFRLKTYWYESRDGFYEGTPIDYRRDDGVRYIPTVHAGLTLGLGFKR